MKNLIILLFVIGICQSRKGFGPGEQDWDFAEVRPGAYMFWWLYYTTADIPKLEEKPLLIWLQGGPGGSSTGFGNFLELGPLDSDLQPRNSTWVQYYNVLFIDSPVGTGFSYVDNSTKLSVNNKEIALDLIECLRLFYKRLPEFEPTPLYITAESYGGKVAAEFALELNKAIAQSKIKSNLKGVMLIDSWIKPIYSVTTWAPYLLNMGFVDSSGYNLIKKTSKICEKLVEGEQFEAATGCYFATESAVLRAAINIDFYNVLYKRKFSKKENTPVKSKGLYNLFDDQLSREDLNDIMNGQVKKALNISDDIEWTETSALVFQELVNDFMRPVTDVVESLLNTTNIKVFVLSAQLDLVVDTIGTYKWVSELNFDNRKLWHTAPRRPLVVNDFIEGYVKETEHFAFYWIDRSGHMIPIDNPLTMLRILEIFTSS